MTRQTVISITPLAPKNLQTAEHEWKFRSTCWELDLILKTTIFLWDWRKQFLVKYKVKCDGWEILRRRRIWNQIKTQNLICKWDAYQVQKQILSQGDKQIKEFLWKINFVFTIADLLKTNWNLCKLKLLQIEIRVI